MCQIETFKLFTCLHKPVNCGYAPIKFRLDPISKMSVPQMLFYLSKLESGFDYVLRCATYQTPDFAGFLLHDRPSHVVQSIVVKALRWLFLRFRQFI